MVLADVSKRPIGVNANIFLDEADNRPVQVVRSYSDALAALGPRYVRYPGAWKSDALDWSAPAFSGDGPGRVIRTGPNEWPANDSWLLGCGPSTSTSAASRPGTS